MSDLIAIWALAESYGAVVVDTHHDPFTDEREYRFPDAESQRAFMAEVARRGYLP